MPTILKPLGIRSELLKREMRAFRLAEFRRLFHMSPSQAKYWLETYTTRGLFTRLKNGVYALHDNLPSEQEIANMLYRPSYISFEYALAFYGILPEMVYAVTSATTKPTRSFMLGEKTFLYLTIKRTAFTGYAPIKQEPHTILIAEKEKALADYLYFVAIGKKTWNERLNLNEIDQAKLEQYASLYARKGLDKLIEDLI